MLAPARTAATSWSACCGSQCSGGWPNDAERLRRDPAMRWVVGGRAIQEVAASASQMDCARELSLGLPRWKLSEFASDPLFRPRPGVWLWLLAFGAVLAYRVFLCAHAPTDTSDLFRHLGFSSHLGLDLYDHAPTDYGSEFWAYFWPTQKYIYPPGVLLFFSLFSVLGLGLFWVKLTLTLCELASSLVIARMLGRGAGLLVFSAPVSVWFTSHEGQFEGLLGLLTSLRRFRRRIGASG